MAVSSAYAGHQDRPGSGPTTLTYTKASLLDVVEALVALTGEAHPLLPIGTRHPLSHSGWRKSGENDTVG